MIRQPTWQKWWNWHCLVGCKAEKANLQQHIHTMESQISRLEQMKQELQDLLEASMARVKELEAKLAEQEVLALDLQQNYEQQIATLCASMEQMAAQQVAQLEALMDERVEQAGEATWQAELAKVQDQIQQVTDHMKGEHEKSLQAECQRSTKAVEGEKKKMRKLVKALAIQEKKLLAKAERDRQTNDNNGGASISTSASKTIPMTTTSSSFNKKPKTTPTTRGPI
jgi:chromosome segregation ATPase